MTFFPTALCMSTSIVGKAWRLSLFDGEVDSEVAVGKCVGGQESRPGGFAPKSRASGRVLSQGDLNNRLKVGRLRGRSH